MNMKVSEAVYRSFTGDGLITGRDENGLYAKYDKIKLDLGANEAQVWCGDTKVASMPIKLEAGDVFILNGLDGRFRIDLT